MTTAARFEQADAPASHTHERAGWCGASRPGLAISLLGLVAAALATERGLRWSGYRMPVLLDERTPKTAPRTL